MGARPLPASIPKRALVLGWLLVAVIGSAIGIATAQAQTPDPQESVAGTPESPDLRLHGFFDVTLRAAHVRSAAPDSSALGAALGQFDLFMSSRLADRISFLGEVVMETDGGESAVDIERAYIRYSFSDHLRVTAGRTHSAVSYWYVTRHHGALLQPTIERPVPVRFEDEKDGGLLPAHAVGLELSGRQSMGDLSLDWVANVANGRESGRGGVQVEGDRNRDKQLGASVSFGASGEWEWHAGGALFHDRTPPDLLTGGESDQNIASAHLAFRRGWVDGLAEHFTVTDRDRLSGARYRHKAWYGVLTVGPGAWRPYLAVEGARIAAPDPFYSGLADIDRTTLGLRYDVNAFNAIKLEYRNALRSGDRTHELLLQTAFTF